jgi:hypothetical protein
MQVIHVVNQVEYGMLQLEGVLDIPKCGVHIIDTHVINNLGLIRGHYDELLAELLNDVSRVQHSHHVSLVNNVIQLSQPLDLQFFTHFLGFSLLNLLLILTRCLEHRLALVYVDIRHIAAYVHPVPKFPPNLFHDPISFFPTTAE